MAALKGLLLKFFISFKKSLLIFFMGKTTKAKKKTDPTPGK